MKAKPEIDLQIIRELEVKMLPSGEGRHKEESPKIALNRTEQLIYADYLESIGQLKSAAFFRLETEEGLNRRTEKKPGKKKSKKVIEEDIESLLIWE